MYRLKPAPCEIVKSNFSVEEVIELMKVNDRTFVLIENQGGHLVGIFTHRDVVKKFDIIADEQNKDRPISVLMSQPLKTLSIDLINTSAEFMVHHKISHVPIVSRKNELLGVVTDDNILESLVKYSGLPSVFGSRISKEKTKYLGVLSPEGTFYNVLDKLFENSDTIAVDRLYFGDLQEKYQLEAAMKKYDALIVDLDHAPINEFITIIREFNATPETETVCLVYDEKLHDKNILNIIEKLKVTGQFLIYTKPVGFVLLMNDLSAWWQKEGEKIL